MERATSADEENRTKTDLRAFKRQRVLLGGVMATIDGVQSWTCTIRDRSIRGANVYCSADIDVGKEYFLVDCKNHIAYLAKVKWVKSKSIGAEFIRTYDLDLALPQEIVFLERLLITSLLRQIVDLEQRGIPLEDATAVVGVTENHINSICTYGGLETEFGSVIERVLPLVTQPNDASE